MLKHTLLPSLSLASRPGWFITRTRGLRPISTTTTTTNIKASSTLINFYSLHTILSFPQLPSSKINLLNSLICKMKNRCLLQSTTCSELTRYTKMKCSTPPNSPTPLLIFVLSFLVHAFPPLLCYFYIDPYCIFFV